MNIKQRLAGTSGYKLCVLLIFLLVCFVGMFFYLIEIKKPAGDLLHTTSGENAAVLYEQMDSAAILQKPLSSSYMLFERYVLDRRSIGKFTYYRNGEGDYTTIRRATNSKGIVLARAEEYREVADICREAGAEVFVYLSMPNRFYASEMERLAGIENNNEYKDFFLTSLSAQGIDTIDLRQVQDFEEWRPYMKTDHHLNTAGNFRMFQEVVPYLESTYGLSLDPEGKYTDLSQYKEEIAKGTEYGSTGQNLGTVMVPMEDFSLYVPTYDTSFSFKSLEYNDEVLVEKEGAFSPALVDLEVLYDDEYQNKYNVFLYGGAVEMIVKNHMAPNDLKLLLISSSYGRAFTPYISQCFEETRFVDPQRTRFIKNLRTYIEEYQPDVVLVLYENVSFEADLSVPEA